MTREERLRRLMDLVGSRAEVELPAWEQFSRRARRSLLLTRFVAAISALLIVAGGSIGSIMLLDSASGDSNERGIPSVGGSAGSSPGSTPTSGLPESCDYPSVRPHYLPWIGSKESIPEPQEDLFPSEQMEGQEPTPPYAILMWSLTNTEDDYYQVTLASTTGGAQLVSDTPVPVEVDGHRGYLHKKGGDDTTSIAWDLGTGSCDILVLVFDAPALSGDQREEEIIRIARSLS